MKPADSDIVRVRKTAVIGSLATRAITPLARASSSLIPTRARGGSMNMQYGTVRPVVARLAPFRLSRITRKSSSDIWVNCGVRSEEHTSELQSLMRISYAVFCLKKKKENNSYRKTHE